MNSPHREAGGRIKAEFEVTRDASNLYFQVATARAQDFYVEHRGWTETLNTREHLNLAEVWIRVQKT